MNLPEKLNFNLVSPERFVFSAEVDRVTLPGEEGDMGILPGHIPIFSALRSGLIEVSQEEESMTHHFFIRDGFAHVDDLGCTVLAEEAVLLADLEDKSLETQPQEIKDQIAKVRLAQKS